MVVSELGCCLCFDVLRILLSFVFVVYWFDLFSLVVFVYLTLRAFVYFLCFFVLLVLVVSLDVVVGFISDCFVVFKRGCFTAVGFVWYFWFV